eukprot:8327-Heterococcus_DN1.PRE.1
MSRQPMSALRFQHTCGASCTSCSAEHHKEQWASHLTRGMRLAAAWWAVGIALCIALLSLITQTLQARALLMILAKLSSSKPTLTIHEEAKGTQQPIVVPNAHKTLNLVLEEEIDKPWKDNDPQVCVLVSTYMKHGLRLTALIASLQAISYPFIDVILLDTDATRNSTQWMSDTANAFNSRSNDPNKRKTVHLSQYTQRYIKERFPAVTAKDYGYLLSDLVLYEELNTMPDLPQCTYIMLTNGDNVYSSNLLPATVAYMRAKYDLIGFEFTSRYLIKNSKAVDHSGRKDQ